jgi:hypothetical protein
VALEGPKQMKQFESPLVAKLRWDQRITHQGLLRVELGKGKPEDFNAMVKNPGAKAHVKPIMGTKRPILPL